MGVAVLLTTGAAEAAFTQASCPWNYFAAPFAVDIGATDYNWDVNNPAKYALRETQSWKLLVNSNVQKLQFGYQNFVTETDYDYILLYSNSGNLKYSGNLGTGTTDVSVLNWGSLKPSLDVTWRSDYSINFDGMPRFNAAAPKCYQTVQPTEQRGAIEVNKRYDGLLLQDQDVIYVSVVQP